jgi:competence protein ComFC
MREILEKVKNGVLDAMFPAVCMGCGKDENYICARCEGFISEVALLCPLCQQSSFSGERHKNCKTRQGLDGLASIWEYEGVMKSLLHQVKYNGVTHAAKEITKRSFGIIMADQSRFGAFLSFLLSPYTFVTYVPMFRKKEKQRGFNQAGVFARELGKIAGKQVVATLEKISDTKPQIDLAKEERLYNVKDVFRTIACQDFVGISNLVLVDDVWTTGATMKECCKVLKQAGVEQVWGITVARTP